MTCEKKDARDFQLSERTTKAILEEAQAFLPDDDSEGFVQLQITRKDGATLLGVDARAEKADFEKLPPLQLLEAETTTTIFGRGSCYVLIMRGGRLESWKLPDSMCPLTALERRQASNRSPGGSAEASCSRRSGAWRPVGTAARRGRSTAFRAAFRNTIERQGVPLRSSWSGPSDYAPGEDECRARWSPRYDILAFPPAISSTHAVRALSDRRLTRRDGPLRELRGVSSARTRLRRLRVHQSGWVPVLRAVRRNARRAGACHGRRRHGRRAGSGRDRFRPDRQ